MTELHLTNVKIRRASPADATRLTEIAHDAKGYWGYPEHWIKHWQDDLTISPDFVATNQVFVAEKDDQILGFYALIIRQDKAELDHMWVAPEHIGSGVGKELFIHAMQNAARRNVSEIEILSDPNAAGFYRKMGAFHAGEVASETPDDEGCNPRMLPRLKVDLKSVS
ncbi:MAG: GNAT family N-acetyltransferase [Acidobacteriota bacterium]|nr:GNAT family N-acetyltransferase [Acidobacteriota bacterium]